MRTKTLLLTAAVMAAGLGASVAQTVYSVNSVGYVNLNLPAGYSIISNPLNGTNNSLDTILGAAPIDAVIYKFNNGGFEEANTQFGPGVGWFPGNTLSPGEGAFIYLPAPTTLTFVGEVPQGNLTNTVPSNYSMKSSQVPQAGLLTTTLLFPAAIDDVVYQWDRVAGAYLEATTFFGPGVGWFPAEPNLTVGEAVFLYSTAGTSWTRTFSVN